MMIGFCSKSLGSATTGHLEEADCFANGDVLFLKRKVTDLQVSSFILFKHFII